MRLAGFLSVGDFKQTSYFVESSIDGVVWRSPKVTFVQTGIALYMQSLNIGPSDITIFTTPMASECNGEALQEELQTYLPSVPLRYVDVPCCYTRAEMYELFRIMSDALRQTHEGWPTEHHSAGEREFIWDMTHGYRLQPALAQMMFHYLQSTTPKAQITDMFYGAHTEDDTEHTRLVSLNTLWDLNYWANAFGAFQYTGRTSYLSTLLERDRREYSKWQNRRQLEQYASLSPLEGLLKSWDTGVRFNDIPALIGKDGVVTRLYHELKTPWDPFTQEAGQFIDSLRIPMAEQFAPMVTNEQWWQVDGMRAQLEYMKWLYRHNRISNFITVSREWLITIVQWVLDLLRDRGQAERIFGALRVADFKRESISKEYLPNFDELFKKLENMGFDAEHTKLISRVGEIRNYISHAGMPLSDVTERRPNIPNTNVLAEAIDKMERLWVALKREHPSLRASRHLIA